MTPSPQPALLAYHNTGLFSDYFLERRLHEVEGWDTDARDAADVQARLRTLYEGSRANLEASANEAQTEQVFIRPLLDASGFVYDVQTGLPAWGGAERPDYAVFPSQEALDGALPHRGRLSFYAGADTIIDAKAWETHLDALDRTQSRKTPSQQIGGYIQRANLDWGVLTNGRKWRLYTSNRERTIENYFEVDLVELLYAPPEEFRYFSCFFTPRAFARGTDGRSFLDRVFTGSVAYAVEVGSVLRDRAYRVVELLSSGFSSGNGTADRAELDRLYANSLIVLYRLLFCFYAEGRELLPIQNASYSRLYSLSELKQRAAESIDSHLTLSRTGREFWSRLSNLFGLVDGGDPDLGMAEGYDGGLFDPNQHPFLEQGAVPDYWLAEAIDQLARIEDARTGQREFVDYGDLKIRDLGTIYEGLLEFRLEHADEPLWLVRRNGREVYTTESPRRERPADVPAGTLYLSNDRRERKASGSYYTPDYIVTAIVGRTLEPLVTSASDAAGDDGEGFVASVLRLRVLDPAMGSGHFLVEAADYLATQIATHPAVEAVAEGDESEVRAWRRRIAESCIFGVDLNPLAVELAKLSLWLATVSVGRPLSFLDHSPQVRQQRHRNEVGRVYERRRPLLRGSRKDSANHRARARGDLAQRDLVFGGRRSQAAGRATGSAACTALRADSRSLRRTTIRDRTRSRRRGRSRRGRGSPRPDRDSRALFPLGARISRRILRPQRRDSTRCGIRRGRDESTVRPHPGVPARTRRLLPPRVLVCSRKLQRLRRLHRACSVPAEPAEARRDDRSKRLLRRRVWGETPGAACGAPRSRAHRGLRR